MRIQFTFFFAERKVCILWIQKWSSYNLHVEYRKRQTEYQSTGPLCKFLGNVYPTRRGLSIYAYRETPPNHEPRGRGCVSWPQIVFEFLGVAPIVSVAVGWPHLEVATHRFSGGRE